MAFQFEQTANFASTTLATAFTAGGTTLTVSASAGFPSAGQFRVTIDSEIFLVTAVSGTTWTVTPGAEGTTPANHASGASVDLMLTSGHLQQLLTHNRGSVNFYEWAALTGTTGVTSGAGVITQLQGFLLYCQLVALNLKGSSLDDQILRSGVEAIVPRGSWHIDCPAVIPELVTLNGEGTIVRDGRNGTITSNYNGDTTSKALANKFQPALIGAVGSHIRKANVYCNPDGVLIGSGVFTGKNWNPSGVTLVSGGSGYAAGNVVILKNPSLNPYQGTKVTINSVDGNGAILTYAMTTVGVYALPDKLQQLQWTAANGFSIFDGVNPGAFLTTNQSGSGSGSGASFTQQWIPDWTSGNTSYYGGIAVIGDTLTDHLRVSAVGTVTGDANYGSTFGYKPFGLQHTVGEVITNGGGIGIDLNSVTDFHAAILNPVAATTLMNCTGGGSVESGIVVLDTPGASYIDFDREQALSFRTIRCITATSAPTLASGYGMRVGSNLSNINVSLDVNISFENCGSVGGAIAASFAYMRGCNFNVNVTNYGNGGAAGTKFFSQFANFGAGVDASNTITGSIDWGGLQPPSTGGSNPSAVPSATANPNGTIMPIFAGTMPGCKVQIWNADVVGIGVGGMLDNTGTYTISGTTPPTTGNWPQNTKMVNTNPAAGNPRGWYCSVAGTNSNGGTWVAL